jgi:hypothetical protein
MRIELIQDRMFSMGCGLIRVVHGERSLWFGTCFTANLSKHVIHAYCVFGIEANPRNWLAKINNNFAIKHNKLCS